jgi:hypothetical protein
MLGSPQYKDDGAVGRNCGSKVAYTGHGFLSTKPRKACPTYGKCLVCGGNYEEK